MTRRFDAIIIGAGQAGPSLADRLTRAGMTVALIERKLFGGTCVNTGCTPTKTLVASAYAAHLARRGREYGVILGPIKIDMARVKARADTVAANSRDNVEKWLRGMPGCTVIHDHASFEGPYTIRVGEERLTASRMALSREPELGHNGPDGGLVQAAAVAIRHACSASALKSRRVRRETRWR